MAEAPAEGAQKDPIMDFLMKFTLGSMRLKPDKWHRLVISDEAYKSIAPQKKYK